MEMVWRTSVCTVGWRVVKREKDTGRPRGWVRQWSPPREKKRKKERAKEREREWVLEVYWKKGWKGVVGATHTHSTP